MVDELETKMKQVSEEIEKRNRQDAKKAEEEFRKLCERDTAGTLMKALQNIQAGQIALQQQIDLDPLVPLARTVNVLVAKVQEIDRRLLVLEHGKTE